jgi:hypothetical protein
MGGCVASEAGLDLVGWRRTRNRISVTQLIATFVFSRSLLPEVVIQVCFKKFGHCI